MLDFKENCELLRPLVAVYTSHSAHESAEKNGLDFAQDPITQQQHEHELRLDMRDLRRSGFLLSHTVFRYVIQESILSSDGASFSFTNNQEEVGINSILSHSFYQTFIHWLEPSEHEFLRTYLACIFVVSTADSDPLNKLAELQAEQYWEQHNEGGNTPAKRISPSHCVPPKWFFPNVLKYYVLLHDNSLQDMDKQRSEEILEAIFERYGQKFCSFVSLNSANPSDSTYAPDIWRPLVNPIQEGLQSGLTLAKQNLYSTNDIKIGKEHPASLVPVSSAPSLSYDEDGASTSVNSSLFTTNAEFNITQTNSTFFQKENATNLAITKTPLTYAQITSGSTNFGNNAFLSKNSMTISSENICYIEHDDKIYGIDLQIIPFVEKHLSDQSDFLINRRSLAKSTFSSMKKWLQSATINPTPINNNVQPYSTNLSNHINISTESVEYQARRLADLAFLFGLYQYANQFYQSLKKEFASDQAWIHHIGCLEMAGISAFLNTWQQLSQQLVNPTLRPVALANLRKLYPQRYLNNAIDLYANVCRQPYLALRALMNSTLILTKLELYSEAAQQLIQFNAFPELMDLSDLIGAVLLEHSARIFAKAGNRQRKLAFYLVTAGTHLLKFTSKKQKMSAEMLRRAKFLSCRLYSEVLHSSSFTGKGWAWADDYLLYQYISCL
uniref:Trafficking protein particle complex subunit 8 n=1 Tax=Meloidogyne hapla TaxID=6305 RepID=A0A1I8BP77_MELHA